MTKPQAPVFSHKSASRWIENFSHLNFADEMSDLVRDKSLEKPPICRRSSWHPKVYFTKSKLLLVVIGKEVVTIMSPSVYLNILTPKD